MARVVLTGNLKQVTGGESEFRLDARNVREVLKQLTERHPALAPHLDEGIAVAIDGEIFQDAWFADVGPDSEVHIMPRIAGG
jgi:molybdopterin converting factor small subunit